MLVKNASNLPLGIFCCSSPVPLRAPPTLEEWRSRCPSWIYGFGASALSCFNTAVL